VEEVLLEVGPFFGDAASMPFIQANGLDIHYADHGTGAPMVLLHGSFDCTNALWWNQVPAWSAHYRLLIPDLRGHGRTRNPHGSITLAGLADDAAAFSAALGLDRPVLAGISMGGMAVLEAGIRHPGAFRALIPCCAHIHAPFTTDFHRNLKALGMEGPDRADPGVLEKADPARVARLSANHPLYPEQWKDLLRDLSALFLGPPPRTAADYALIREPTLAIIGDRDEIFRVEDAVELYRNLKHGELAVLPGHTHCSFFNTPDAPLNALVLEYLKKLPVISRSSLPQSLS
jgi:pimeloyl-ACP methyl ester carboxylesterase